MSSQITKKLINSPETCVDDNLRGIVALYPKLHLHPKHRVVTYGQKKDSGRVAILSGGGSGHEPFAAGLIGPGMLDGAVAGGVFASPPTGNVLYAIAQLYKYNSGGVLVSFGNYTGDRLTFGKALEKAKAAGIKVEGFIVGEDVASSHNKTGGRGMVGEIFIFKILGALTARGADLYTLRDTAVEINKNMATLGVSLSACSLPGQRPLFETAPDEMELGTGMHGEAGTHRLKLPSARDTVALVLDQVVGHLKLKAGDRVASIVNNLGGTSLMEMNILAGEIKDYLNKKQIILERIFSGHLKTSLEMHGVQICLLHLNKENGDFWLDLIDAPTEAVGWTGGVISVKGDEDPEHGDDDSLLREDERESASGPSLAQRERRALRGAAGAAAEGLLAAEALLNALDSGCGDGDCGVTLAHFARAMLSYLERASLERPSLVLRELSELAESHMGGTSGGVYSLGLAAASRALAAETENSRRAWVRALREALAAICKYGGAEPGDRTMVDTLHSTLVALEENLNDDLKTLLTKAEEAAERGAKSTANMVARAGRASYVSREHQRGEDAGARASAIWLKAILAHSHLTS